MRDDELYHYRTKGSKNGISTDPNYTPIGQRAQGPSYLPGSTANRQYRESQQQQARMRYDEGVKRLKSSAQSTANAAVSGINSAASRTSTMVQDAQIRRELEKRRRQKEKEAKKQARKEMINRGLERLGSSATSTANAALKKSGARLTIGKRGVGANPYEQGYTGVSRSQSGIADRAKYRQERMKQAHEDAKAGKYGKLAAAKAYGKEGLDAATRIAKQAKRTLNPGQLKSQYYKTKYNISRDIDDLKREATSSDAYKRVKSGIAKASSAPKSVINKASKTAQKAQRKASDLYERSTSEVEKTKTRVKEKASEAATAVGSEAERLKKKGLSLLKKLRK